MVSFVLYSFLFLQYLNTFSFAFVSYVNVYSVTYSSEEGEKVACGGAFGTSAVMVCDNSCLGVWMSVFVHPDIARVSLDGVLYQLVRVNKAVMANYWQEI